LRFTVIKFYVYISVIFTPHFKCVPRTWVYRHVFRFNKNLESAVIRLVNFIQAGRGKPVAKDQVSIIKGKIFSFLKSDLWFIGSCTSRSNILSYSAGSNSKYNRKAENTLEDCFSYIHS